ncbi:unnamed protein product [Sphagnum compactum]
MLKSDMSIHGSHFVFLFYIIRPFNLDWVAEREREREREETRERARTMEQQREEEEERGDGGEQGAYRRASGQEQQQQQDLGGEGEVTEEEEEEEGEREVEDDDGDDEGRGEGEEVDDDQGVRDGLERQQESAAVSSKVENGAERDRAVLKGAAVGGTNAGTNLPLATAQNRQNGAAYVLSGEAVLRDDGASSRGASGQEFGDGGAVVGSLHEQARIVSGPLHEQLHSTTDADNYYTNLLNSQFHAHHDGLKNATDTAHDSHGSKRRTMEAQASAAEPPLRVILADPVTGEFMDDAMLLSCGHSVGKGGLRRVMETNVCITCGASVLTETMTPNYALQSAVQAYKQEEELAGNIGVKSVKRRREPAQLPFAGQPASNCTRMKGVQYPFAVNDHVMIMGNKRTPERFVGREAVITTQCLNGWYLVRTLDNGESVRLQYRSLQKSGGQTFPQFS